MALTHSTNLRDYTSYLWQAVFHDLCQKAMSEDLSGDVIQKMGFKLDTEYSIVDMTYIVRLAWRDPDSDRRRAATLKVDESTMSDTYSRESFFNDLREQFMDMISIKGELYYFKLHKHFPNALDKVSCGKDGRVTVVFNNGRVLTTEEAKVDSTEFLATCGMVYDL